jgi:non-heme chloroperoxidase
MVESVLLRNGVTLEYVDHGDPTGLPVVMLHGATDSWRSFEGVLPHVPSSLRALAVSLRGHGGSSRPEAGYRFVDFSADVRLFLDALGIREALIVGHSMGSYVAQRFAMDHPARTLGLVLMGSFPTMRRNVEVQRMWASTIADLTDPVDPTYIREFQVSTLARPVPPALLDTAVRESQRVPARVWRGAFADFLDADFSRELRNITAPTLIMWGDQDAICPRSDQDVLFREIPGSQLIVYAGAGHAFHWEDPAQFSRDLTAFVMTGGRQTRTASASAVAAP